MQETEWFQRIGNFTILQLKFKKNCNHKKAVKSFTEQKSS